MTDGLKTYTDFIADAASQCGSPDLETIGKDVLTTWFALETAAKSNGYDVLGYMGYCRDHVLHLIRLLYQMDSDDAEVEDVKQLLEKDAQYGGSWCKRGGVGAFMMACRKMDRLDNQLNKHGRSWRRMLFDTQATNQPRRGGAEGPWDDVGDLRRYLVLWEAWWMAKEHNSF